MTSRLQASVTWLIAIGSVLVAGGRFTVPGHGVSWPGSYEAVAHIWVGVLLCLGFTGDHKKQAWLALGLISLLEVVMAVSR
jgi:hypothetical protein